MLGRRSFPSASTALLILLAAAPLRVVGQSEMQIAAALSCVFFWSLFRPASMPPWVVFLLGVLVDLVGFAPLGVGVLILLAAHGVALRTRRYLVRQGFLAVWLVFSLVALGVAIVHWLLSAVLSLRMLPAAPAIFLAGISIGLYPVLATALTAAHRSLADPDAT